MSLIDILFPKECLQCGRVGHYICNNCLDRIHLTKQVCIECEKPAIDGMTHINCLKRDSLKGAISIWNYEGIIRKALIKLKYNFAYKVAEEFADITVKYLRANFTALPKKALLLPVPLHIKRQRWRGFNQSAEMGELIAEKMGWKYCPDLVIRTKSTRPQMSLSEKERLKNVLGIFSINPLHQPLITNYRSLILFDDVRTTGTTLKEIGKVLKKSGAGEIWGLTISR
jgi:ComF family protein